MFETLVNVATGVSGYLGYALALAATWATYAVAGGLREKTASLSRARAFDAPPSLHPVISPALCIGCGACTHACPEGEIIGMIGGKAELIDAASCIGHGACKTSCPVSAIDLVFGTAKRGVDIPQVSPDFQSNVSGLYIAGELGGMGLIANAVEQGCQVIDSIAKREGLDQPSVLPDILDVVIVGSGPAGFAASLAAKEKQLRAVTLEQNALGGSVAHYPRGKLVMTRPARLPLFGTFKALRVSKEKLLDLWQSAHQKTGVQIRFGERVDRVTTKPWGFEVVTNLETYAARTVVLATGRRGAPRKLNVPGEGLSKVVYSLVDADQYRGRSVLVVGGGNSAIEAAVELGRQLGAQVTLSYRGKSFARVTPQNLTQLEEAEAKQRITVLRGTTVVAITADAVELEGQVLGQRRQLPNEAVIVCAGGLLPMALLNQIGVEVETRFGTA